MPNVLTENTGYAAEIPAIEVTDPAIGGIDGALNKPSKALAARTKYLKDRIAGRYEASNGLETALQFNTLTPIAAGLMTVTGWDAKTYKQSFEIDVYVKLSVTYLLNNGVMQLGVSTTGLWPDAAVAIKQVVTIPVVSYLGVACEGPYHAHFTIEVAAGAAPALSFLVKMFGCQSPDAVIAADDLQVVILTHPSN
ncbi:MAG: hypothetical protein SFY80_03130 [Verrucomicrobiota bacterium]|nr:hypothetical protein [Verrucomicrobiota bacterium]